MATVNKDFRIKSGLVVEGANGTINGSNIITEDAISGGTQTNISVTYDANSGVINFVAENGLADSTTSDLVEGANLYFTDARAKAAVADDIATAKTTAIANAALDATTKADAAEAAAKLYADGLAGNYDAAGSASTAQSNANTYTDTAINGLTTSDIEEGTNLYFTDARAQTAVADNIATAKTTAIASAAQDATTKADAALASANTYTDGKVADLVGTAPDLLNTLNELSAAIADNPNYATDVANLVATKADTSYVDANFVNVADLPGQLDEYVPLTQKAQPDGVATLDATGYVPASQLGNQYIQSTDSNHTVSNGQLKLASQPLVSTLKLSSSARIHANAVSVYLADGATELATLGSGMYESSEVIIKAKSISSPGNLEITKILILADGLGNVALTEYGNVITNNELFDVTAIVTGSAGNYATKLMVTAIHSDINVTYHVTALIGE